MTAESKPTGLPEPEPADPSEPGPTPRRDRAGTAVRLLLIVFLILAPFELFFIAAIVYAAMKAGG